MAQLHFVGTTLSDEAKKRKGDLADAFGRSAFNRYYYAAYLEVRSLLLTFNSRWRINHDEAPNYLRKNLQKIFREEINRQQKRQVITHAEGMKISSAVLKSASIIAQDLEVAYKVRAISDYEPEELVTFDQTTFHLDSHSEVEAKGWLKNVQIHKSRILKYGKVLDLV